ncbi:hypothetical protein GF312_02070 [Candidatus Poribacteria bacterium]|nr:hypothetical protein [Candidatus Poribacteria bacterium]
MARFRIGGSGPDNRGLGKIEGIDTRRFDVAGEIYETNKYNEIIILRKCLYVNELTDEDTCGEKPSEEDLQKDVYTGYSKQELENMKMKDIIKLKRGLYRVGMTKAKLINALIESGY